VDEGVLAWYALQRTQGLGPRRLAQFALRLSQEKMAAASLLGATASFLKGLGLPQKVAAPACQLLANPVSPPEPPNEVTILTPDDERFPIEKMDIRMPLPVLLYVGENASLLRYAAVAISGSRDVSEAEFRLSDSMARNLVACGFNVVSGNAAGIDQAAHEGALRAGGTTTVVLASGISKFKPRFNPDSVDAESIAVVSQFSPDDNWTSFRAMERNRTIAGLSDAVLVIVARGAGGAWAQGRDSLKAGKQVFVPEQDSTFASGNRELIKLGAIPFDPTQLSEVARSIKQLIESKKSEDPVGQLRLPG
jgi:DNA protecting protein DprA